MAPYKLQLNKTHLLYIPAAETSEGSRLSGTVVQVCLRTGEQGTHIRSSLIFAEEQECITDTIETLLFSHINTTPNLPECIVVTNPLLGYTLAGARKPWKYGQGVQFFIGGDRLRSAEDKWVFTFKVSR